MKKGIVSILLDYYQRDPLFHDDLMRVRKEFFGSNNFSIEDCSEEERGWFFEWLVYDFLLTSGMTPLQDFLKRNPLKLLDHELQHYRDIADNVYGLYEILSIDLGTGMRIRNVHSGLEYDVREKSGTYQATVGHLIFARVGQFPDHYEFIGSNGAYFPFKVGANLRKAWRLENVHLTPKSQYDLMKDSSKSKRPLTVEDFSCHAGSAMDPKEAERNMRSFLKKYEIESFVTVEKIKEWIFHMKTSHETTPLTLLAGLFESQENKTSSDALNELLVCYNLFYNTCPQKKLRGKSPTQKVEEHPRRTADIRMESTMILNNEWGTHSDASLHAMARGDYREALKENNLCFAALLKSRTTFREVYRIYANKALQHFSLGDRKGGELMLHIALNLNPKYDFGIAQIKKYESGEFESMIPLKSSMSRKTLTSDPAYRYYLFLQKYGISFTTSLTTVTEALTAPRLNNSKKQIKKA